MPEKHAEDITAIQTGSAKTVAIEADPGVDEVGEASFPASDPPSSWTWDVAGRPPGSATR